MTNTSHATTNPEAVKSGDPVISEANKKTRASSEADLTRQIELLQHDLGDLAETTLAQLEQLRDAGRQQAQNLTEQTNDFVRKQPTTALAIAAGLGLMVGLMARRG